ncbi:MAG: hypothetical protein HYW25_04605 [Candidatus Aenigmarchaeota archaeon]|nr:hypothetical protein [Candidatus Aenigmarchaeota archaeon]
MTELRKVEEAALRVASIASVNRPLNSYHLRASRKLKPAARELYERLADGQQTNEGHVYAQLDWETGATARGYKLGVEEFSRIHPEMAEELRDIIAEQRECKRTYVTWEIRGELPKSYVMGVLRDIGLKGRAAETTYNALQEMASRLEEKKGTNTILVD